MAIAEVPADLRLPLAVLLGSVRFTQRRRKKNAGTVLIGAAGFWVCTLLSSWARGGSGFPMLSRCSHGCSFRFGPFCDVVRRRPATGNWCVQAWVGTVGWVRSMHASDSLGSGGMHLQELASFSFQLAKASRTSLAQLQLDPISRHLPDPIT